MVGKDKAEVRERRERKERKVVEKNGIVGFILFLWRVPGGWEPLRRYNSCFVNLC